MRYDFFFIKYIDLIYLQKLIDFLSIDGLYCKLNFNRAVKNASFFITLIEKTNIHNFPVLTYLYFFDEKIIINDTYFAFAGNSVHNFYYCLDSKTGNIILLDEDRAYMYPIAKNEDCFIDVMTEMIDYEIAYLSLDIEDFKHKIVEKAGGLNYKKYYELIW